MKKSFILISILIITFSCSKKVEPIVGHWHEYYPNDTEYRNCYKISDSTALQNNYEGYITDLIIDYNSNLKFDYSEWNIKDNNRFILQDTIVWIRQKEDLKTYILDFSSGLLVKINPYEINAISFDNLDDNYNDPIFHIGKLKENYLQLKHPNNSSEYQIQLNDRISDIKNLRNFLYEACDAFKDCSSEIKILINADKNTPKDFLDKVEYEILDALTIDKNQIYYLTINSEKKLSGFNHRN
jgi:hypothetical protein